MKNGGDSPSVFSWEKAEKVLEHPKDMWYNRNIPKHFSREAPVMEQNPILKLPLSLDSEIPLYLSLIHI